MAQGDGGTVAGLMSKPSHTVAKAPCESMDVVFLVEDITPPQPCLQGLQPPLQAGSNGTIAPPRTLLHGVPAACGTESPRRTRSQSQVPLAGPLEAQPADVPMPTWAAANWKSESQRKAVEARDNELHTYDNVDQIYFVPALVVEYDRQEESEKAAGSKVGSEGGGGTEGKQGDGDNTNGKEREGEEGKGKGREEEEEEEEEDMEKDGGEAVSILGMRCFIKTMVLPGTPELQLSGIRKEWSRSTREHYQVVLSHFKAAWSIYTKQLGVPTRSSPFIERQSIFMAVGDGRVVTTGKSATAAAFLSLFARFTKVRFRPDCAVTAELTLSGLLMPVGSVQTKLRGAKQNGIKRVVLSTHDYARLPEVWKKDSDLDVQQARTAYELIRLCRNEQQAGLPLKDSSKVFSPFFTARSWYHGDITSFVEVTAYSGSGRLIITGLEQNDPKEGPIGTWNPRGRTNGALALAMRWLESEEEEEWFRRLPSGQWRLDLKRRMLVKETDVVGTKRKHEWTHPADIHIHFPQHVGSSTMGLAIVVALAQLMRGRKTRLRAWYKGCVQACGNLSPSSAGEEEVTREDFDVIIVPQCRGDEGFGHPRSVPEGKRTLGFSHAARVIEHIYQPEYVL